MQYVGETVQKFNEQVNWHKSRFKHPCNYGLCGALSDHCNKCRCKWASFKVQIIEKIEENRRFNYSKKDASITQKRKRIEINWFQTLRTVSVHKG